MNLIDVQNSLILAATQQNFNIEVKTGDIYENLNTKDLHYPIINIDCENVDISDINTYNFMIYYVDRVMDTKENLDNIEVDAINSLKILVNDLRKSKFLNVEWPIQIQLFYQQEQFADILAGGYVRFSIKAADDINYCNNTRHDNILTISENGEYDVTRYNKVIVDFGEKYTNDFFSGVMIQNNEEYYNIFCYEYEGQVIQLPTFSAGQKMNIGDKIMATKYKPEEVQTDVKGIYINEWPDREIIDDIDLVRFLNECSYKEYEINKYYKVNGIKEYTNSEGIKYILMKIE